MNNTTRKYPRSMSDAFPDVRASSITRHKKPSIIYMAMAYAVFIGISLLVISQMVEVYAKFNAQEEARLQELEKQNKEKQRLEILTEMCGGVEATVVHLGNGLYECVTKRGFKQRVK